jgi:hypothetical protein
MLSMPARLGLALVIAMTFAATPVSIQLDSQANGADAARLARLVSPALPAWADDDDIDIDIDNIGKVKRGAKKVMFTAEVQESDLICTLSIKYADGDVDTVGNDESDKHGHCEISFDVPDRKSVIGDATAKLKVETKTGDDRGKDSRSFYVRGKRGD